MIFAFIEQHQHTWPIRLLCQTLGVSFQGFYAWRARSDCAQQQRRDALLVHIQAIHAEFKQRYGSPRMHRELNSRGLHCCENTVARLMRHHGVRAKTTRPFRVMPVKTLFQRAVNPASTFPGEFQ